MRLAAALVALAIAGSAAAALVALAIAGSAAAAPRSSEIADPDTRAWWQIAEALASDAMQGRDIGSPGFGRAADVVVQRFKAAGLQPAGDRGGWFQTFPVHEVRVDKAGTSIRIVPANGPVRSLAFLHEVSVRANDDLAAAVAGPLTFRGYCGGGDLQDVQGKVVVCFNTKRRGLPSAADRIRVAQAGRAAGLVQVDDPYFTIEPPRWPAAYARTVTAVGGPPPPPAPMAVFTLSAAAFKALLSGSSHDADAILAAGGAKRPLASFDLAARLEAKFHVTRRDYTARNVITLLPGRDPALKSEILVLSAHLDGYGYGEPVDGDALYNGALDDAAYVGTLIRFAENHRGQPLRRSVLFLVTTGEEKGLLGAHWFVDHPTVPKAAIVADLNLDQLRPLFPLKILTELGVDDSTLGGDAKAIAASMGVRIQPDPEPERGLMQRADHWPFIQAGIPATGFIFGYEPGTEAERRYREWYQVRYHRPQDDLTQPMDFQAAGDFNRFFYKLAERVADAPEKPRFTR
ncbi:MAG: M28 family peptidase [Phenylobacterium sp.]